MAEHTDKQNKHPQTCLLFNTQKYTTIISASIYIVCMCMFKTNIRSLCTHFNNDTKVTITLFIVNKRILITNKLLFKKNIITQYYILHII